MSVQGVFGGRRSAPHLAANLPAYAESIYTTGTLGTQYFLANSGTAMTANTLHFTPLRPRQAVVLTSAHVYVQTAVASSNVRLGIYRSHPYYNRPFFLVHDFDNVATTAAGEKIWSSTVRLDPGSYWVGTWSGHAPSLRQQFPINDVLGIADWAAGTAHGHLQGSLTFGTWPATLTQALTSNSGTREYVQFRWFRP